MPTDPRIPRPVTERPKSSEVKQAVETDFEGLGESNRLPSAAAACLYGTCKLWDSTTGHQAP